jgi:hypothetical protein
MRDCLGGCLCLCASVHLILRFVYQKLNEENVSRMRVRACARVHSETSIQSGYTAALMWVKQHHKHAQSGHKKHANTP